MIMSFHGAGNWSSTKSNPNGVSPMRKELASADTAEQSGEHMLSAVHWDEELWGGRVPAVVHDRHWSGYGCPWVAQHGKPQLSPARIGISFSRPPIAQL